MGRGLCSSGSIQKIYKLRQQFLRYASFALPNSQDFPAIDFQDSRMNCIALPITRDLSHPIFPIVLRNAIPSHTLVSVPEATMDEDDFATTREYQVGFSGQIASV